MLLIGAIAVKWLLRMPWSAIAAGMSLGSARTNAPSRYLSRSRKANGLF